LIEVYYYIHVNDAYDVAECGMSLQKWYDKEIEIGGQKRKFISAFLNPRDDIEKYRSNDYKCLKMNIPFKDCYIAEKYYYYAGLENSRAMDLYLKSIIPVDEYVYGTYRLPECLIGTTILPDRIVIAGTGLDTPVLFNNSEELYINNIIELKREEDSSFSDALLYFFYSKLAENNKIDKIENANKKFAVFIDKNGGKSVIVKIPEI